MKFNPPATRTTLDVAYWFKLRSESAGQPVSQQNLQALLYLAQGHYVAQNLGSKLMPATFLVTELGPMEPNIYQLFRANNYNFVGDELSVRVENYLLEIWDRYGNNSTEQLSQIIKEKNKWEKISRLSIWQEIPLQLIYQSFSGPSLVSSFGESIDEQSIWLGEEKEYWTMSGKKARRWIPGLSKKSSKSAKIGKGKISQEHSADTAEKNQLSSNIAESNKTEQKTFSRRRKL